MRESSARGGRAVLLSGRGHPDCRLRSLRSHPHLFLSVRLLTPVLLCPYTFCGFSHVLPTPHNSLPSPGLFRLRLRNSSRRPALPDGSSSPGLAVGPGAGHACVIPTELDRGRSAVPSCLTLCCDCRPSCLSSHRTLGSLNGTMPFLYTPSPGSLNGYLTNEATADPYLITM